uniref:Peptidase M14 domain-containing protein n=1 Tax=Bombyx mori TaxID=7091 RepID=A0A8R2C9N3_BOMMO|nr:carboxypeptidase B isoform X1 [Bombyx mori]
MRMIKFKMDTSFFVILALVSSVFAGKHDIYSRHAVYGVELRDQDDVATLFNLQQKLNVDIWEHGMARVRDAEVMVSPEQSKEFFETLDNNGLKYYLKIEDVSKVLKEHEEDLAKWRRNRNNRMIFQDYPRYAEVNQYMEEIAARYPNLVTLVNAGKSFEGRDIKYLKISTTNFEDPRKPVYFMDGMMHAREWVTTPVTMYSIFRLVENLRDNERDLLEDIDWIILPIVNPDGYEFSHTDDRLWRRTRSVNLEVSTTCFGVDANRNFDVDFNTLGVSSDPCSQTYPGVAPFSEPETRIVRDILSKYLPRIQLYNNIHSHGNYVLFGFGNNTLTPNVAQLHHVAAAMGAAMDAVKLPEAGYYLIGNSGLVLYRTSGSAQDYGQHVGVPFSYTLELPGYGYDFRVPPSFIDHINEETWKGIAITARLSKIHYRSRTSRQ